MRLSRESFLKRFDTSILEPQISDQDLEKFVARCKIYADYFAGIAFNPHQVPLATRLLRDTGIHVATVVAYPLGGLPMEVKAEQVKEAVEIGAKQVDVCMAVEALLAGDYEYVERDARVVARAAEGKVESLSLIPNTAWLNAEQQLQAARIARDVRATYKTNTGFGLVTEPEHVKLIRDRFGEFPRIMVSGGCRTVEDALAFFDAGADMIATSTPFQIFEGMQVLLKWQDGEEA